MKVAEMARVTLSNDRQEGRIRLLSHRSHVLQDVLRGVCLESRLEELIHVRIIQPADVSGRDVLVADLAQKQALAFDEAAHAIRMSSPACFMNARALMTL